MTTITELFNQVTAHNPEGLKNILDNTKVRKAIKWAYTKKSNNLLGLSVTYHSKECFDILITMDEYKNLVDSNNQQNYESFRMDSGIHTAIDYYENYPSNENEYYLNKLLELFGSITLNIMYSICRKKSVLLFNKMFHYYVKDAEGILSLIKFCSDNFSFYEIIYSYLEQTTPHFFTNNYIQTIFDVTIKSFSVSSTVIQYLESKGLIINNHLHNMLKLNNNMFDYIFSKLKNLTEDELKHENYDKLRNISFHSLFDNHQHLVKFHSLLSLPIKYTKINEIVNPLIETQLLTCDDVVIILYILLYSNLKNQQDIVLKVSPQNIEFMNKLINDYNKMKLLDVNTQQLKSINIMIAQKYDKLQGLLPLLKSFQFEMPDNLNDITSQILNNKFYLYNKSRYEDWVKQNVKDTTQKKSKKKKEIIV